MNERYEMVLIDLKDIGKTLCQAPAYTQFDKHETVIVDFDGEVTGTVVDQVNPYNERERAFMLALVGAYEPLPKIVACVKRYEVEYNEV